MGRWMSGPMNEWVDQWMGEWVSGPMSVWVDE